MKLPRLFFYQYRLKERNPKGINNDYCKFIRLGQHFVNRTQEGVLALLRIPFLIRNCFEE